MTNLWFVDVADLDGSGTIDVIAPDRGTSYFKWFSNNGQQQFTGFNIDESIQYPQDFVLKDFDDDGDLDIALLSGYPSFGVFVNGQLTIYRNEHVPIPVEIEVEVNGPLTFALEQNYPNPFNPSTLIKYSVPENSFVKLSVYNLVGEEVSVLVNETVDAGFYKVTFNAANLPSGIYFYRLQAGNFIQTKKMVLLR